MLDNRNFDGFFIICFLVFVGTAGVFAQTLTASDGEVEDLYPGHTYTLHPIPPGDTSVTPIIYPYGFAWGEPMIFSLTASPGSEFKVDISLHGNRDSSGGRIASFFSDSALRWDERDLRMDPKVSQTIIADSAGRATLFLGISIVIPAYTRYNIYGARAHCRAVNMSTGDSLAADANVGVYVLGVASGNVDGEMKNLSRNRSYALIPGTGSNPIAPLVNGREQGKLGKIEIDAEAGASVLVSTVLPSSLSSDVEAYLPALPCTYSDSSFYVEETGEYIDPLQPIILQVGAEGRVTLDIGLILTIPADAVPGGYAGQMILSVTYTGNAKSSPRLPRQSEAEVLITAEVLSQDIPEQFTLLQNYPNPFNPITEIKYSLKEGTHVLLQVFDILGREVKTLANELQPAGFKSIQFDASSLPSGVYFYKLTAGRYTDVKKMLLAK